MNKTLRQMADEVRAINVRLGWYDDKRTFGEDVALLHSEVSEALEQFREIGLKRRTQDRKAGQDIGKPDDVGSELADILIRLLDVADRWAYNLDGEYDRKVAFNRTREYRHGGKLL